MIGRARERLGHWYGRVRRCLSPPGRGPILLSTRRRPSLEIHVPISPTPTFFNMVRCLVHSLRRNVGAYRDAPVIVTADEGGLATFRDPVAAERFRLLRSYGFIGDYNCKEVELNGKLSELNAALGWLSLELLPEAAGRRQQQMALYREELGDCLGLTFQDVPDGCVHGYKDFAVLFATSRQRAVAESALARCGVQTKRYFFPVHRMKVYAAHAAARLPVTDDVYERVLCLPVFFDLTAEQICTIAGTLRTALRPRRELVR